MTYLYNTLHYYERKLRDRPALKKRLVSAVLSSLCDIRPSGWALSEPYMAYMIRPDKTWVPELDYYVRLVRRIVESILLTGFIFLISTFECFVFFCNLNYFLVFFWVLKFGLLHNFCVVVNYF